MFNFSALLPAGSRRNWLSIALIILSGWQFGEAAWIHGKAELAQRMIAGAWHQTRANDTAAVHKPWPWADTWPVAKLQYLGEPAQKLYVLAGAQGNSLAFGPGHLYGSAAPGTTGVSIIGGHRDTHFAFLQQVNIGDQFMVTPAVGPAQFYRVTATHIADSLSEPLLAMPYASQLLLVTCYPFDAVRQGSLRFVVTAELQDTQRRSADLTL